MLALGIQARCLGWRVEEFAEWERGSVGGICSLTEVIFKSGRFLFLFHRASELVFFFSPPYRSV